VKRKALVILVLMVAAAGVAAYYLGWVNRAGPAHELRLAGHIEATETNLGFKVPGKISAIYFEEGQEIKAGQVVAELESGDLRQEVAVAEGKLSAARANLDRLESGFRPQEVKESQAAAAQARADLVDKERDYKRMQALFVRKVVSASTRDRAEAAYLMAKEAARRAHETYDLRRQGYRREDIEAGRAEVEAARAQLELAKTRLGYARITSPVTAVVLARPAEPGQVVAVGTTVLTIGDLDHVWFEGWIPEPDLAKVRLEQEAFVTTDAYPGKKYSAWVSYISAKAEFTPKMVETYKERVTLVYRTKIRLDNPEHRFRPGMPAAAVIELR
jgi:HlyD family secretion protein